MKMLAKFVSILILLALTNTLSLGMGYPMDMFAENGVEGESYAKPKPRLLTQKENLAHAQSTCKQPIKNQSMIQKEKANPKPESNKASATGSDTSKGSLTFQVANFIWKKMVATINYIANIQSNYLPLRTLVWTMSKHIFVA